MSQSSKPQNKSFKSIREYIVLTELNNQAIQLASNIGYQFQYIADSIKLNSLSALTLVAEGSALGNDDFLDCTINAKAELQGITACLDIIETQQVNDDRMIDTLPIRLLLKDAMKQLNTLIRKLKDL